MKQKKNKKEFALSNDLIRLPNRMSLNNLQIFGVILSNFDWKGNDEETIRINVETKEIRNILSDKSNNTEYYLNAIRNFIASSLVIRDLSNEIDESTGKAKEGYDFYMMFPFTEIRPDCCTFEVNKRLNKYIQLLKQNYTVFKIANTANFTSRFSYVLYTNLCSWNNHRSDRDDPLDERSRYYTTKQLKEMFDIGEDEYQLKRKNGEIRFNRTLFEKRVIEKSVSEINKYTDIQVDWYKEYEGRNVSKYVFDWFRKDGYDYETGTTKI